MKLKKTRRTKTALEKEQSFGKIGTNLLLVVVFVIAIIVAFNNSFGNIDLSDTDSSSLSTLSLLVETVDTSKLFSDQLSDEDKPTLINKIKAAELDILTNNELDYSKYASDNISISGDLTLTSSEVGLLYSYLFVENTDKYNTIFYEVTITTSGDTTTIKTVASINFYNAFTSKLTLTNSDTTNSLPRRIYLTNTTTYTNGVYSYSQVLYNNLSESNSKEVSSLVNEVNSSAKLNEYVPNLLIEMIETWSTKTGTTYSYSANQLQLKKTLI